MKKKFFAIFILLIFTSAMASNASAWSIDPRLIITGSVEYVESDSFIVGDANIVGTITAMVGGIDTDSIILDDAVALGANPLSNGLTDIGDGFSSIVVANARDNLVDGVFQSLILYDVNIVNTSDIPFDVNFEVSHTTVVDADGADAKASSVFLFEDNQMQLLHAEELISDTVLGDQKDGVALGTFGDAVAEAGTSLFTVRVGPQDARGIVGLHLGRGHAIDSEASLVFTGSLNVNSVEPIPEPATVALLGIGLVGLAGGAARRKFKKKEVEKS